MTPLPKKSINDLLQMPSMEVRNYLQTLSASEQKTVSAELYRAMLSADTQKIQSLSSHSQNKSDILESMFE